MVMAEKCSGRLRRTTVSVIQLLNEEIHLPSDYFFFTREEGDGDIYIPIIC